MKPGDIREYVYTGGYLVLGESCLDINKRPAFKFRNLSNNRLGPTNLIPISEDSLYVWTKHSWPPEKEEK